VDYAAGQEGDTYFGVGLSPADFGAKKWWASPGAGGGDCEGEDAPAVSRGGVK
jgi:hypothetical protein